MNGAVSAAAIQVNPQGKGKAKAPIVRAPTRQLRTSMTARVRPKRSANSLTPASASASPRPAAAVVTRSRSAFWPNDHSACATMAMMTGLMPISSQFTCGVAPKRT